MGRTYTTRSEAIEREIVQSIEASGVVTDARAEFDVEAIAEAVIAYSAHAQRFYCQVGASEFWAHVQDNERGAAQ